MDMQHLGNLCEKHRGLVLPPATVEICTECAGTPGPQVDPAMAGARDRINAAFDSLEKIVTSSTLNGLDSVCDEIVSLSMQLRKRLRATVA